MPDPKQMPRVTAVLSDWWFLPAAERDQLEAEMAEWARRHEAEREERERQALAPSSSPPSEKSRS